MPSRLFYLSSLDESISITRVVITLLYAYIPVPNANSVDPDQTPQNAASDPGLHCLPMSYLWDASLKWDKYPYFFNYCLLHIIVRTTLSRLDLKYVLGNISHVYIFSQNLLFAIVYIILYPLGL